MLQRASIAVPEREALWLIEAVTGASATTVNAGVGVSEEDCERVLELARRRVAGEPLQYLTGVSGFRALELSVGPGTFIPRPETEILVERALARLPLGGVIVDVGTGSGAIALAAAQERVDASVYATEASPAALRWARLNRQRLGLAVELVSGDLLNGLSQDLQGGIDVVVSNPPYVSVGDSPYLPSDVRDHEPHEALFSGPEGLEVIERLAAEAREWLTPGGWLVLEIGASQGPTAANELTKCGYHEVSIYPDLAGQPRVAEGRHG
ncbi:peptide chain release factor N(5)-glutamine methyltransferase [soil metagenome]